MHIHLAEQAKEVDDCLSWCGRRPATWLLDEFDINEKWCLVHATHVDNRELERIAGAAPRSVSARLPKPTWAMASFRPRDSSLSPDLMASDPTRTF